MKKQKHAEVIHAWADGLEIQRRSFMTNHEWADLEDGDEPCFMGSAEWRVKPAHTARDLAIAQAVLVACMHSRFTIPGEDGIDLAAIIATVKE